MNLKMNLTHFFLLAFVALLGDIQVGATVPRRPPAEPRPPGHHRQQEGEHLVQENAQESASEMKSDPPIIVFPLAADADPPNEDKQLDQRPGTSGTSARNAIRTRRWTGGKIPYVLSTKYTADQWKVVTSAFKEYHDKTCVRFIQRTNEVDYIEITPDDGKGNGVSTYCYSDVGKQGKRQFVKMYGECVRLPAMIHELGHAIGLEHEHNRPDRDTYITIQWKNINSTYYYAYDKTTTADYDTLGLPYDYYSIMHYPDYSFAFPGYKAFKLNYPGYSLTTENKILSATDVHKINKYYNCCYYYPCS